MRYVRSREGFTLVEIMIVVVIIGLLAAMAVPTFQRIRQVSREKTVSNNLRQVASAGQQYILANGQSSADYTSLVGTYFVAIQAVAGEDYTALTVSEDGGVLTVTLADSGATTVTFEY